MSNIFDLFKKIESGSRPESKPVTYIMAGLGNPGVKYEKSRHNAGFIFMENLMNETGAKIDRVRFKSLSGECVISEQRVLLLKPQTYMNNSGEAVKEAADFYKIPPEHILIIYDDINLEPGKMRVRRKGSDGGHNGIKSIIAYLGSDDFPRIKLGVGNKPRPDYDLADWVLSEIPPDKREAFSDGVKHAYSAAELILSGKTEEAMGKYN